MYKFIAQIDQLKQIFSPNDNICPYYLIDRQCNVFSEYSGKELKQIITENGYKAVSLNTIDGKRIQRRVHRLGMMTFYYFPGCENYQVNHKDGNKFYNDVDINLEWSTSMENVHHAIDNHLRKSWGAELNPNAKISTSDALLISRLVLEGYSNEDIIDIIPNSNDSIITQLVLGHTWRSIFSDEIISQMKNIRYPIILSIDQKHKLCKYFQDFPCNNFYKGSKKDYINNALINLNIPLSNSTFRMAKRLYYKYQDPEITSQYNY